MFFRTPRILRAIADAKSLLHLHPLRRLLHRKAHRPVAVVGLGTVVMVTGSVIASAKDVLGHMIGVHHIVIDTVGYFIHAVGALPAIRYIEPMWLILFGSAEEAESLVNK